jgi:hypothetical protein
MEKAQLTHSMPQPFRSTDFVENCRECSRWSKRNSNLKFFFRDRQNFEAVIFDRLVRVQYQQNCRFQLLGAEENTEKTKSCNFGPLGCV